MFVQTCLVSSLTDFLSFLWQWYTDTLGLLKARGRAEAIKRGENIQDKTLGIQKKLLNRTNEEYLQQGDAPAMQKRAVATLLFNAVGRGGKIDWDVEVPCDNRGMTNTDSTRMTLRSSGLAGYG